MKRVLLLLFLLIFLVGCGNSNTQNRVYYRCPYCDEPIDHEPDPEYLFSWLEREGYVVISDDEVSEFAWSFFVDDPEMMSDFMGDYAEDYLRDQGWTLTPPRGTPSHSNTNSSFIVYWVPRGEVYHSTSNCPSLSKSTTILSGTIDEAKASGKYRPCERCW